MRSAVPPADPDPVRRQRIALPDLRRRLLQIRPVSLPEPAVQAAGVPELVLLLEELRQFVDVVRGEVLSSQDELPLPRPRGRARRPSTSASRPSRGGRWMACLPGRSRRRGSRGAWRRDPGVSWWRARTRSPRRTPRRPTPAQRCLRTSHPVRGRTPRRSARRSRPPQDRWGCGGGATAPTSGRPGAGRRTPSTRGGPAAPRRARPRRPTEGRAVRQAPAPPTGRPVSRARSGRRDRAPPRLQRGRLSPDRERRRSTSRRARTRACPRLVARTTASRPRR